MSNKNLGTVLVHWSMNQTIKDLRTDVLNSIDSAYAEYTNPDKVTVIEGIKGVFLSSESYDYPELKKNIIESIEFLFSEEYTPKQELVEKNIESAFLSWRYND